MDEPSVVFHPAAFAEYLSAHQWYSEHARRLDTAFREEIGRAVRLIAASPKRWPRYGRRHRRFLVRRFPYSLVYLEKGTRIWIVAVAHGRRKPGYWIGRAVPSRV